MSRIHRILYAVDQADSASEAAFRKVVAIAKSCDASIDLFHAITSALMLPTRAAGAKSIKDLKRECVELHERRLERLAALAGKRGVAVTWSAAWDNPPHEAIVRRAERIGAELIIVECHKGTRGNPRLMYLTDFELLRNSELPVLLLKNTEVYRRPLVLAAVDPAHAHAKPLDLDTRILAEARDVAASLHGKLHVMHASNPSLVGLAFSDPLLGAYASGFTCDNFEQQGSDSFKQFMTDSNVPAARRHLVEGNPAKAIPSLARELRAQLVVMGAVSRSGLKRAFIGNTAERVLRELPCDVLVVKPAAFKKRVQAARRNTLVLAPGSSSVLAN